MNTSARILLVEDDPADARLVLDAFSELHLDDQVLVLTSGGMALDYLHARGCYRSRPPGNPAVILLDVKLPGMSGFEVLKQIRANPVVRFVPVVILSASRQECDLRQAYELGANGYLVKTIDFAAGSAGLKALGHFWAIANEPPSGSLRPPQTTQAENLT